MQMGAPIYIHKRDVVVPRESRKKKDMVFQPQAQPPTKTASVGNCECKPTEWQPAGRPTSLPSHPKSIRPRGRLRNRIKAHAAANAKRVLEDRFIAYKQEQWQQSPLAPGAVLPARERMAQFRARVQAKEAANRT